MGALERIRAIFGLRRKETAMRRTIDQIYGYPISTPPQHRFEYFRIRDLALSSSEMLTIFLALSRSIFRRGLRIHPNFTKKCTSQDCAREFDYEADTCDHCGAATRDPDEMEKQANVKWLKDANLNHQSLEDVCIEGEADVETFDDVWLQLQFNYRFAPNGQIIARELIEIIRADPAFVLFHEDGRGNLGRDKDGNEVRVCPNHRGTTTDKLECPTCRKPTYPAYYFTTDASNRITNFMPHEMVHGSKYHPSRAYGYSPVLT